MISSEQLTKLNKVFCGLSISAKEMAKAIQNLSDSFNKIIPKEYKIMEMKLILMQARLQTLEGRNTECERIRAKLRRQIRNLKAAMAKTLTA
jgi:hypothetical protein